MNLRTVIAFAGKLRCLYHDAVRMAVCAGIALALLVTAVHVLRGHHG